MEWTEPSGITYELRLHEHTSWYRPKTQADEEWRKGNPRDFLFR